MSNMFSGCSSLTSLDVSNFDTSNVTTMACMFQNCASLTSLEVSNFNTNKVTDMTSMFNICKGLTSLDVSNFDTSNVTSMKWIFRNCSSLTIIDASGFNTSNVTNMQAMFNGCTNMGVIYVSKEKWDMRNVTDQTEMFVNCGTNVFVSKSDNTLFGYQIEKGKSWSGSVPTRTGHSGRASSIDFLKIDSTKTYTITMNNPNYYFGIGTVDSSGKNFFDSGWKSSSNTVTLDNLNNTGRMFLNFKYQSAGATAITDDMVNEIMSSFTITLVE